MSNIVRDKVWNLSITYPKHTKLEDYKSVLEIAKKLNVELLAVTDRISKDVIKGCFYTSIRLAPGAYLLMYVDTEVSKKPLLIFYDGKNKTYSLTIPHQHFLNLKDYGPMWEFEDKCRNISSDKYKSYMHDNIHKEIKQTLSENSPIKIYIESER